MEKFKRWRKKENLEIYIPLFSPSQGKCRRQIACLLKVREEVNECCRVANAAAYPFIKEDKKGSEDELCEVG
jgi:hypothetical protein